MKSIQLGDTRNLVNSKNPVIQEISQNFSEICNKIRCVLNEEDAHNIFTAPSFRNVLKSIQQGTSQILSNVPEWIKKQERRIELGELHTTLGEIGFKPYSTEFDKITHATELVSDDGEKLSDNFQVENFLEPGDIEYIQSRLQQWKESKETSGVIPKISFVLATGGIALHERMNKKLMFLCSVISREFEKAGIDIEFLFGATSQWSGGKSKKKWAKNGGLSNLEIQNPGRLNDMRFTVIKGFGEKYVDIKDGIKFISPISPNLSLFENIDGEVLTWAGNRLKNKTETGGIIVHLTYNHTSWDDATDKINGDAFLQKLDFTCIHVLKKSGIHVGLVHINPEEKRKHTTHLNKRIYDSATEIPNNHSPRELFDSIIEVL